MADPVTAMIVLDVAMMAASMALTASQKIKGARLDDLSVSLAEYGVPIPRFWGKRKFQPQIIWAEPLREVKTSSKTKGGKIQGYKYYGSFAVLVCDHPIDSISRIWMDKHLVYQVAGAGPVSPVLGLIEGPFGIDLKLGFTKNLRIYKGSETQTADPRIEAWCEDRYGADSCPAYRGSSYIVFEEIPLEKFGDRIPQITVEAISSKTTTLPYEQVEGALGGIDGITPDFTRLYQIAGDQLVTWDLASRSVLLTATLQTAISDRIGVTDDGFYAHSGGFISPQVWHFGPDGNDGVSLPNVSFTGMAPSGCTYKGGELLFYPDNTNEQYQIIGYSPAIKISCGFSPTHYFADENGQAWCVGTRIGDVDLGLAEVGSTGTIFTGTDGPAAAMDNGNGQFLVWQENFLLLIDKNTLTVVDSAPAACSFSVVLLAFDSIAAGAAFIWLSETKYDTQTLDVLETIVFDDWVTEIGPWGSVYDPVSNAIVSRASGSTQLTWRYLDRVGSDGVTLQTVVDDVAGWCGLSGQDSAALTQTVLGYSVTQGSGKDMIGPLLDIHDVDARPHDFTVQFLNRGGSPTGTKLTPDFVRGDSRYTVTIQQDTDLPRKLTFNFADIDKDQQANNAIAQRPLDATDATREETIDLSTYADSVDLAQQKADRFFRRAWNSRERVKLSLTAQELALEPGDVTTLSLDGTLRNARLDKMTIAGQQIDCEFVRDETAFAVLNTATTGAEMEGRDPETVYVPAPTKGFVLDIPLIEDADNDINPLIYVAAGPYGSGSWPGAIVMRGDDGTYDEAFSSVSSKATWGYATTALATANPNLWDRGNTVRVNVLYGTLTSTTEAAIDADPTLNFAYLGGEFFNFVTATLVSAGVYDLTGLKRGRRGTEWAVDDHAIGDEFVLIAGLSPVEVGTDDIGDALSFKVQSVGRNIDSAPPINMTFSGATLKPYAPASVKWYYDGTDLQGTITRRTRVGGNWNGSTIPLSETSEEYEIDVYNGSTLKRTITATTTAFTYTAAMAAADGITLPTPPTINAYQMSATVGRGFALAA